MTEFHTETTDTGIGVVRPVGRLNMVAAPRLRSLVADLVETARVQVVPGCFFGAPAHIRIGLGGEGVGKGERAGGQRVHGISSDLRPATVDRKNRAHEA